LSGTPSQKSNAGNQSLNFDIKIADSPLFNQIIPDLKKFRAVAITGRYNSVNDSIVLNEQFQS
jgi:hypothetical protein